MSLVSSLVSSLVVSQVEPLVALPVAAVHQLLGLCSTDGKTTAIRHGIAVSLSRQSPPIEDTP